MANQRNVTSISNLFKRVLTELWVFSVDTFVSKEDIQIMSADDATVMMNRIINGTEE